MKNLLKCSLLVMFVFALTGCATFTGKAKPVRIDLTTGFGYEDREQMAERESYNLGPVVTFDNGHEIALNYRYRRVDDFSQDECGVFFQYTLPIWEAKKDGAWGEGDWINPIDTSWWPSKETK